MRVRSVLAAAFVLGFRLVAYADPVMSGALQLKVASPASEESRALALGSVTGEAEQVGVADLRAYLADDTPAAIGPGTPITGTPEPPALLLFGTGAMGVAAIMMRRRRRESEA